MSATGILADAYDNVVSTLTAAGVNVVTDPRNVRPLTAFVELPTVQAFNSNIIDATIVVRLLAPPPSVKDSADYLLTQADLVHQNVEGITTITPSSVLIGEQQIPAIDLTVRISTRRN